MEVDQLIDDPQFPSGIPVFDVNGEKVGTIRGREQQSDNLVVTKGWFFPKDALVPSSAIVRSDADGVYLSLDKGQLIQADDEAATADSTPVSDVRDQTNVEVETGNVRIPVYAEELVIDTKRQETGRVHIHKQVRTEEQTVSVPLRQEHVSVERVALDHVDPTILADAFVERDFEVRLLGEEAVVGKRVTGVEEVLIHKDVVTETERVSDTVREERVIIDEVGRTTDGVEAIAGGEDQARRKARKRR